MIVYVLLEYIMPDAKKDGSVAILGVFDNEELAEQHREELTNDEDEDIVFYDILEYQMNILQEPEGEQDISDDLEELMKKEIIDYTIGEDGEFYFHLTDKGKEIVRGKRDMED